MIKVIKGKKQCQKYSTWSRNHINEILLGTDSYIVDFVDF